MCCPRIILEVDMRSTVLVATLLAAACSAACLDGDTRSTMYLSPDGAVTWLVVESDVHSDLGVASGSQQEEDEFLADALDGDHPVARGLRTFGATSVRTMVVRDQRPFTVATEGRFASLEALFGGMMDACGVAHDSSLERIGTEVTWTLTVPPDADADCGDGDALADAITRYRVVLQQGRFVRAAGFHLDGCTVAEAEDQFGTGDSGLVLSLTWAEDPPSPR